ncbi:helix-turn-helix domain-containing protein [Fusibacter bizertensis]
MHGNTLTYRLNRIEEILKLDLNDYQVLTYASIITVRISINTYLQSFRVGLISPFNIDWNVIFSSRVSQ